MPHVRETEAYLVTDCWASAKSLPVSSSQPPYCWNPAGLPLLALPAHPSHSAVACCNVCFPEMQFLCYSPINSISGNLGLPQFTSLCRLAVVTVTTGLSAWELSAYCCVITVPHCNALFDPKYHQQAHKNSCLCLECSFTSSLHPWLLSFLNGTSSERLSL